MLKYRPQAQSFIDEEKKIYNFATRSVSWKKNFQCQFCSQSFFLKTYFVDHQQKCKNNPILKKEKESAATPSAFATNKNSPGVDAIKLFFLFFENNSRAVL